MVPFYHNVVNTNLAIGTRIAANFCLEANELISCSKYMDGNLINLINDVIKKRVEITSL